MLQGVNMIFPFGYYRCRRSVLILFLFFLLIPLIASADFYKYLDESGGVNVTNDYNSVPERYRAGVTVVSESDLQKKAQARDKQFRDLRTREEEQRRRREVAAPLKVAPESQPAIDSKSETTTLKSAVTGEPDSTGRKFGWFERQLPLLKVSGIIVLFLAAAVVVGRLISALVPRTLGIVIRIALFTGVAVYVFNAFSERISKAFLFLNSETEVVQKTLDKRYERIEKQAVDR
jgi:hypothetical protein